MKQEMQFIKWINGQFPGVKTIIAKKYCVESMRMLITILLTLILGMMIQAVFYEKNISLFLLQIGTYSSLFGLDIALGRIGLRESKDLQAQIQIEMRKRLYRSEIRAKAGDLHNISAGDNMYLFTQDVETVFLLWDTSVKNIVTSLAGIMGTFAVVCFYDWRMSFVILFLALFIVCITNYSNQNYQKARKNFRENSGEYSNWITEHLKGMKDIRMNQCQQMTEKEFQKVTCENLKNKEKIRFIEIRAERTVSFVSAIFTLVFWACAAAMIIYGNLTVGLFYVINKYFKNTENCIAVISQEKMNIRNGIPNFQNIKYYCSLKSERDAQKKGTDKVENDSDAALRIKNVSFSYQDQKVLGDLNCTFEAGKMVVISGANGTGKTTLLNLILRFYRADRGEIQYGGKRIEEYDLEDWRDHIGYVQQDSMIFEGSLRDNILLYAPEINESQIWQILRAAGLETTVMEWKDKLDTDLQQGERLSDGQKQRVAIARVIAKNPSIVLLDEPTANLDYKTEEAIILDIKKMCREKILIVITHRDSVAKYADMIVTMNEEMTS